MWSEMFKISCIIYEMCWSVCCTWFHFCGEGHCVWWMIVLFLANCVGWAGMTKVCIRSFVAPNLKELQGKQCSSFLCPGLQAVRYGCFMKRWLWTKQHKVVCGRRQVIWDGCQCISGTGLVIYWSSLQKITEQKIGGAWWWKDMRKRMVWVWFLGWMLSVHDHLHPWSSLLRCGNTLEGGSSWCCCTILCLNPSCATALEDIQSSSSALREVVTKCLTFGRSLRVCRHRCLLHCFPSCWHCSTQFHHFTFFKESFCLFLEHQCFMVQE